MSQSVRSIHQGMDKMDVFLKGGEAGSRRTISNRQRQRDEHFHRSEWSRIDHEDLYFYNIKPCLMFM